MLRSGFRLLLAVGGWVACWAGQVGRYLLLTVHAPPFLEIRPGAETFVDFAREYQHPRPRAYHSALSFFFPRQFILGLFFDVIYLTREFGE